MARRPKAKGEKADTAKREPGKKCSIEQYEHKDKHRPNNPPVGLVSPETDPSAAARKTYQYDAHLDPQLVWAGKAEIDEDLIESCRGTASLPSRPGRYNPVAVKIVVDRGIESLRIMEVQ